MLPSDYNTRSEELFNSWVFNNQELLNFIQKETVTYIFLKVCGNKKLNKIMKQK